MFSRPRWLSVCSLVALLILTLTIAPFAGAQKGKGKSAPAKARRPNIILILADDLDARLGTLDYMPNLKRLLAEEGLTLADYFVTNSLCCPSRTTYLRGQYTHSHQVFTNRAPAGGYEKFVQLGHENSTVATWLAAAGYRTALFGKYLNGYALRNDLAHVPPGWTEWYSPASGNAYGQYNYELNENGRLVPYRSRPEDYMMDVLTRQAMDFIRRSAAAGTPFFVYMAPYAPHGPSTPAPRHKNLFAELKAPRTPSFNEAPAFDAARPHRGSQPLPPEEVARIDAAYAQRVRSMQAVDEMIATLITTLRRAGQLDNTYIVFTSDNGFHMGQHRLLPGKSTAYEEDVNVPFLIRGPGVPRGEVLRGYLAGNVDIAPTFAELAGVAAPEFVEGRSLAPLFSAKRPAAAAWRQAFLIEQYSAGQPARPRRGAKKNVARDETAREPDDPSDAQLDPQATYVALRTLRYKYIERPGGRELYDLASDPHELKNLAASEDALVQKLSAWLSKMHVCAGSACRAAESNERRINSSP